MEPTYASFRANTSIFMHTLMWIDIKVQISKVSLKQFGL